MVYPPILTTPGGMSLDLARSPRTIREANVWESNFRLLVQFRDREGHLGVSARHVEDGQNLGSWIRTQRSKQRKGKLCPEKERRLNEIGGLICDGLDAKSVITTPGGTILNLSPPYPPPRTSAVREARRWDFNLLLLQQFRDREGHLRVPAQNVEDGQNLGRWTGTQRALGSERDRRLNEIGFIRDAREAKSVITTPGGMSLNLLPPRSSMSTHAREAKSVITTPGGMSLNLPPRSGMSTPPNPYCYNSSRPPRPSSQANRGDSNVLLLSSLTERVSPPTSILTTPGGMILNLSRSPPRTVREASVWESNFLLLLQFRDREGHLRVPALHVEDCQQLGAWTGKQRAKQRKGKLCPERERRLNDIGFIWNVNEAQFDTMIRALTQFQQREGHRNVLEKHIECLDGGVKFKLGAWVKNQRCRQVAGVAWERRSGS
jgi:hypothetical protein